MILNLVTITGADNNVSIEDLTKLNNNYPHVEFGILFSPTRQGESRYPTIDWQINLAKAAKSKSIPTLSAHLCGKWVRDILAGNLTWDSPILPYINRVQLNMVDYDFQNLDLHQTKKLFDATFTQAITIILQTKRQFERSNEIKAINAVGTGCKFAMLYDVSGGKGQLPKQWANPVPFVDCGFAGGLNPDNLSEHLATLRAMPNAENGEIRWIDVESGVRTDDKFSLEKVNKFLSISTIVD